MTISVVDLFSIGIGPSSSHTVGPMRATKSYLDERDAAGLPRPARIRIELRGSLAATGRGHGTDRACVLGLAGWTPIDLPATASPVPGENVPVIGTIAGPAGTVAYEIDFNPTSLELHPNGMIISALGNSGELLDTPRDYYSIGGGFIATGTQLRTEHTTTNAATAPIPYPFSSAAELLTIAHQEALSFAEIMAANETAVHGSFAPVHDHLVAIWRTMRQCVTAGIGNSGILPGGLQVKRRAPDLYRHLLVEEKNNHSGFGAMEWVNLYALAVNEENAAGGRVVTAPTNGAAGIIPAVMHYARDFLDGFSQTRAQEFLLTAGAIGVIIKHNASISGAEVGCQGEVGSASAMAAAGLAAVLGGTPAQVENAAEIGLEHNLGLTCDPVGGLVQIPCIERNAIGAVKAINAARLACLGDGTNRVTLDDVVATMADTGRDMSTKYKETATGGLAIRLGLPVSLPEC